ncbi:MAG: hypothetical protein WCL08_00350 [Verrucomicrobiota bacterium]
MPSTGKKKAEQNAAYYEERREAIRKQKREWYRKNRDEQLKKRLKNNRKKWNPRNNTGVNVKKRVKVPKVRRWTIIEDDSTGQELIYFNTDIGFGLDELKAILDVLRRVTI